MSELNEYSNKAAPRISPVNSKKADSVKTKQKKLRMLKTLSLDMGLQMSSITSIEKEIQDQY